MAEAEGASAEGGDVKKKKKGGKKKLILILLPVLLLAGGGGGAYMFVPAVHDKIAGLMGKKDLAKKDKDAVAEVVEEKPFFVEVPELTVTLPNNGRPRQLRLKLALEFAKNPAGPEAAAEGGKKEAGKDAAAPEILTPRIYDGLVLYLRTLRDAELDGALSIDRMRGDLQRRLDLLLGEGVLRDVLITSLIIG